MVEGTARTQLKAAFARLGVSRQSELAILITKLGMVANTRGSSTAKRADKSRRH